MSRAALCWTIALTVASSIVAGPAMAAASGDRARVPDPAAVLEDAVDTVATDASDASWEDRALAGAVTELAGLDDLGALQPNETVIALVTIVGDDITTVEELERIDDANVALLAERRESGDVVGPGIAAVLDPLTERQLAAARSGDGTLDAAPWVAAVQQLVVEAVEEQAAPGGGPAERGSGIDVQRASWLLAAVAVVALLAGGVVALRQRSSANRATADMAHSTAIVLEASRTMTGAIDGDEVRRLALRTAIDLAGGQEGAWIERGGAQGPRWDASTPGAALRDPVGTDGLVARALATGQLSVGDATAEPWIDAGRGGIVAVPVIDQGEVLGAVVVQRATTDPLTTSTTHGLTALGPVTAAALSAASAHRGAIDASLADPLTGLPNRRRLDLDLAAAGRTGRFALAMVDVDHFKVFNDSNGHAAGDLALRLVGRALGQAVRAGDTVYRYGGEEFCVVLPRATDPTIVATVAERLRGAVHDLTVPGGESQPAGRITASIGVAVRTPEQSVEDVLFAADAALYRAKRLGRDRVELATA